MAGYEDYYIDDLIKANKEIVITKFIDTILDENATLDESFIFELALDILELTDDNGSPIFKLNSDLHFDDISLKIFEAASIEFLEFLEENKKDISEEQLNFAKNIIQLLTTTLESKSILKKNSKVRFVTLPDPKNPDSSILMSDVIGNGPHGYKFELSKPSEINSVTYASLLLRELSQIEEAFSQDASISLHTGTHKTFQSEGPIQVRRNVRSRLRIPILQYGENTVAIAGIFHKIGDNDPSVQKEYDVRNDMAKEKKKELADVDKLEKLYYDFKMELIKKVYDPKFEGMRNVYRYFIDQAYKKAKEEGYVF